MYGESTGGQLAKAVPMQVSLHKSLTMQLDQANKEVARLQELITLIDNNPDVSRILELLGRGNF
jgi:hypothetical protein